MASSPSSLPNLPITPIVPSLPLSPPAESPPAPNSSAPPPSTPSPPPPDATSPPPAPPTSPPPAPPTSPPPPPPSSPPPPPPAASPPPQSSPSPPPPASQDSPPPVSSPPPPPPVAASPPAPAAVLTPPPSPSPPAPASPVPENSPPPPPPSTDSSAPPPTNSTSPPAPPTSSRSPSSNHTTPSESASTPISSSETPGSSVPVKSISSQSDGTDHGEAVRTGVAIGVVAAVVIIGFMMVIVFVRRRRKRHDRYNSVYMMPSPFTSSVASGSSFMKQHSGGGGGGGGGGASGGGAEFFHSSSDIGLSNSKAWFTYEDLTKATNGFASQNILGAGGFGCVYKGCLQDGREVAVKKLKDASGQGDREFKAEVEIISRVHHRHLVILVGYCITDYQRLLVYEFVPNNTLHYHLHASNKPVMQWTLRVKVACGSARGLAYLHEDCHPRIIHRDIKSANILLDNNFDAKVADFGLAKLAQELELNTHVSTRVMGTFGYMAPEYASSGKLTEKSDVFSFGVVLLELITGRKPVDETRPLGDESLVEWARPLMSEALESQNFDELTDARLGGNYDRGEMFRMIEAAAACVRHSASKRPKMSQVVRALDTMNELSDLSNGMKPGQSGIIDTREQSAQIRMFQRMAFGSQEFSSEYHNSHQSSWMSGGRSGQV